MASQTLELEHVNFDNVPIDGCLIVAGPSRSGKTTVVLDIMHAHRHKFSYATVFSGSEKYNHTYSNFVHPMLIKYNLDKAELENAYNFQAEAFMKDPNQRCLMVIDDQMSRKDFLKWPITSRLFYECRHINLFLVICTQYLLLLEPSFRTNAVGIVFTKQPSVQTRRGYHQQFFDGFHSFEKFDQVYRKYTSDYKVIFLLIGDVSYNPLDTMKFYMSPNYRNGRYALEFRIGSEQLWSYLDHLRVNGVVRRKEIEDIIGIK
jgi:hypothetical protein